MDEAFTADGEVRPEYADLLGSLGDLDELTAVVAGRLERDGVRFGGRPFPLDPVPRLICAREWRAVTAGLSQRARALGAFVADAYGDRRIVAAGVMPARVIGTAENFEPWMVGVEIDPEAIVIGIDLVRGDDGELRVLEDNTRTPSGMTFAIGARAAVAGSLPAAKAALDPTGAVEMLARTLGVGDRRVAILSDGPSNAAWYEHRRLGDLLGIPVLQRDHAPLDGLDAIYRRTDEDRLRDHAGRATWVADLLLAPVRRGRLKVVNPLGAGIADDKLVHGYVEDMVRFYLGEQPLLRSVRTLDLADDELRAEALGRLGELVVKPRGAYGGDGVVVCRDASDDELAALGRAIEDRPSRWVAQEMVNLCTHPTVCDGRLEPRHVDLRPYVFGNGDVAPAALTRVALAAGDLIVNSSRGGGAKDTWLTA